MARAAILERASRTFTCAGGRRATLRHSANLLPAWFLKTIGVRVGSLNRCGYCAAHHTAGLWRGLRDDARAEAICAAIAARGIAAAPLDAAQIAALRHAETLTRAPASVSAATIARLRASGLSDGEILGVNQVSGYFACPTRLRGRGRQSAQVIGEIDKA
jgi:AhpD family alkylhydroperoxidase